MFQATTALRKIQTLSQRIRVVQGGTSASKTVSILLVLINEAQSRKVSITIASESLPHLKRGAMRDFLNILKEHDYYREENHNKTDGIYTFETGAFVEFVGADEPSKMRGPRRDILFINEANNVSFEVFSQLEIRTKEYVILDYNPVSEFWAHTQIIPKMEHDFVKLTYKDNEALDERIIRSIESRKDNEQWWRVYGLGEVGENKGQIYNWQIIDELPEEARLVRRGQDFGYTNHPTAIGAVYKWNDALVLDEEEYRNGLQNPDIAQILLGLPEPDMLVIADSAEPKSIDEIRSYGLNIQPAVKGPGSINFGINTVQSQTIYITKRSTNGIKEMRNYLWKLDKDGNPLNVPQDAFNHFMDAIRYAISDLVGNPELTEQDFAIL